MKNYLTLNRIKLVRERDVEYDAPLDVLPYFDFDMDKCREYIRMRNPKARVLPISARTGEGIEAFAQWLLDEVAAWKAR